MVTDLALICHGRTRATRLALFPDDEPLDPGSMPAIRDLGNLIRRPARAWTSPALRARQTAEALGLAVETEPRLRECDYGTWRARALDEIGAEEPAALSAWLSDAQAIPHGGESLGALRLRVGDWLDGLRDRPGRLAAVTHASVIRAAFLHVFDAPFSAFWRIDVEPLGIVHLRADGRRWTLRTRSEVKASRARQHRPTATRGGDPIESVPRARAPEAND